ncbi:hypothetical protein C9J27_04460 [Photobacterium kishitanii]|uniref:N-acetyltransferase n=1 Tax=Photobacterium kishitanii TaxID=318456 RepID=A0A2T3KL41_9GAMM|nr:hypothetical protein C9J27_04460 [Photobacterium kishitanii]
MENSIENEISAIVDQFEAFKTDMELESRFPRSRYFTSENISIYVRKQLIPLEINGNTEIKYHLCIASIDICNTNRGTFTTILSYIENNIGHFGSIEVECLMNKPLELFLRKRGYTDSRSDTDFSISLIKNFA